MTTSVTRGIHLGYEVPSGAPVSIPIGHMVVTGLTQHAGKTTAIQALLSCYPGKSLIFVTKRGEIGFEGAEERKPHFREQVDWQYVEAILEGTMRERMKFERSWIMRASKGAETLAEVQRNVKKLLLTAKGLNESVYTTLDHYLDIVVPQIARGGFVTNLPLGDRLNVMKLGHLTTEMQALVIRACIDTIMSWGRDTIIVLPEAWEFLPQKRGGPVKLAAESLFRKGAVLRNFGWLDSQDIASVDKVFLKSVGVWLLGAQPESNEAERTIAQIPLPSRAKPKPDEIQSLKPGTFFACWAGQVRKVYVQPSWMRAQDAETHARGGRVAGAVMGPASAPAPRKREEPEMCEQHQKLAKQVEELDRRLAQANLDLKTIRSDYERAQGLAEEANNFRVALGLFLGKGSYPFTPAAGKPADVEEITRQVLARMPLPSVGGAGILRVIPLEKLTKDFQREESERILDQVRIFTPLQKRMLKLLIVLTREGAVSQRTLAERMGRAHGGDMTKDLKGLEAAGFIQTKERVGVAAKVRTKIEEDLSAYGATPEEVEAVYQGVLGAIAEPGD